jgi:thiol-disulfide isomerase/thioredoxin
MDEMILNHEPTPTKRYNPRRIIIAILSIVIIGTIIYLGIKTIFPAPDLLNNGKGDVVEVKASEVIAMIEDKKDFVFVFSISTCINCTEYKPILKIVADELDIDIVVIEADLDKSDDVNLLGSNYLITLEGTPKTFFFKDGKVVGTLLGNTPQNEFITWYNHLK